VAKKKIKGRKRQLVIDTTGLLVGADVPDGFVSTLRITWSLSVSF
jgi:hypothetical protein